MGEALNRLGDWYGAPVNLASRVTAVAQPASVLATQRRARRRGRDSFDVVPAAGRKRLRGSNNMWRFIAAGDRGR